jgi:alanine dehydrogenase
MNIGIPKEQTSRERRVALNPAGVQSLVEAGHAVFLEAGAGALARYSDEEYERVGAKIVYTANEVFKRASIVLKVSPPTLEEYSLVTDSQILISFLHLPVAKKDAVDLLLEKKVCAIGYELIEAEDGNLPILQVMSEIAGQMAIHIAAHYLQSGDDGRGVLLGRIPGIAPATVVIIGAGTVGRTSARVAIGSGAEVTVLDNDLARLRELENIFHHQVATRVATRYNIGRAVQFADVVIGAVLLKGEKAPHLVTEEMVKSMKPRSVILDISIDQGGCVETSRPTTLENPVFLRHGVIHYCVPNIPASVARTATNGLTNALLPYVLEIADHGLESALHRNRGLRRGVCTYDGSCTNPGIAKLFGLEVRKISDLLFWMPEPQDS